MFRILGILADTCDPDPEAVQIAPGATPIQAGTVVRFDTSPSDTNQGTFVVDSTFNAKCFPPGTFPAGVCGSPAT